LSRPFGDMWALGCVLYAMLCGGLPFNDSFLPRLQLCIMNGKYDTLRLDKCHVSNEAKEIIKGLLEVDVNERWDIDRVLSHPWVQAGAFVDKD
jgi:serine/threonine protein kinase